MTRWPAPVKWAHPEGPRCAVDELTEESPRHHDDRGDLLHRPVEEAADPVDGPRDPVVEAAVEDQDAMDVERQSTGRGATPLALDTPHH